MHKRWSKQEVKLLTGLWNATVKSKVMDVFPGRSWKSIKRKSQCLGLVRLRPCAPPFQWAGELPSWMVGEMLSDGHITRGGAYSHTTKHFEYARFLCKKFSQHGVQTNIYPDIDRLDIRTGKKYSRWIVTTRRIFKRQRVEWYPQGKKIVPEIKLDDEVVLHLFMGDGSINQRTGFTLCTEGFDSDSLGKLIEKLSQYGLVATIRKHRKSGRLYFKKMGSNNVKAVARLVRGSSCPECYKYKLDGMALWASTARKGC